MNELPSIEDVVVQTTAVVINLAARALGEERRDEAKQGIDAARALIIAPGLMIFITVLSVNLLGNGLRDALDPRLKQ